MKTKTYFLVLFGFFLLTFLPVMLWGTTTINRLEYKMIHQNHAKIETINQQAFGEFGLVVMGADELGNGQLYSLIRMPGLNRYWITEVRDYATDQTNMFAEKDLTHWALLRLDNGVISDKNTKSGFGYLDNVFLRILIAAGIASIGALIIDTRIRRRKKHSDTQAA